MRNLISIFLGLMIPFIVNSQTIQVDLKVYLEGPYYNGQMTPFINILGYLPAAHPYNTDPWNYPGDESVTTIPSSDIVDWVLVDILKPHEQDGEIRFELMGRRAGFLMKNGYIKDLDATSNLIIETKINYGFHIRIHHRNHLPVISANPLFEDNGIFPYDYTDGADKAYGGVMGHKLVGAGHWGMISGDGNASGQIDNRDKNEVWLPQFGFTGYYDGDFNMNTQINSDDKVVYWKPNAGKSAFFIRDTIVPLFICGQSVIIYNGLIYGTLKINDQCWLDRNLGASQMATAHNDILSFGDLYQWGRLVDGHQVRTSPTSNTLSNNDNPGHGAFILTNDDPYDWRNPQNDNLWQQPAQSNNPCPPDWRLPTLNEWQNVSTGWTNRTDAFNSLLKLPSAGWRNESIGSVLNAGTWGNYWTSTVNATGARGLQFDSFNFNIGTYARGAGKSARCLKAGYIPNNPPDVPSNPFPANEAMEIETDVTLSWVCSDPDGDELTYNIYFGTEIPLPLVETTHPHSSWTPGLLNIATTYLWKVVANDIYGDSNESPIWNFTTRIPFNCGDLLFDNRDGQSYGTVLIGDQCWMAENLNIGTMIPGANNMSDNGIIEKYCYENISDNCDTYGGLYHWNEMMQYTPLEETQGICPDGWHVPADSEWCTMSQFIDSSVNCNDIGISGTDAGLKMKSTYGWAGEGNGTNTSGMNVLPSGYHYNGLFNNLSSHAYFWSSTIEGGDQHWCRIFAYAYDFMVREEYIDTIGFSVRCIKDYSTNQPPSLPTNPTPENGATNIEINTSLSWSCSDPDEDELYYNIYFGTDPNPALILSNHPDTFYLPGILDYASTYFWKIVAYDIHGDSTEGNIWSFTTKPEFECGDILMDTRDNRTYTTVQIGAQCWMSENLNFGSRIDGMLDMSNNNIIEKYCYGDLENNCNSLGALYQWDELMVYTAQQGTQGICPVGWHVPTDTEWFQLANFVDLAVNNPSYQGWMGIDCGTKMKEGGETEFEVLMAGERLWDTGEFIYSALRGFFWTSNQNTSSMSWFWRLDIDNPAIYRQAAMKTYGLSIRCMKDEISANQSPNMPFYPHPGNESINIKIDTTLAWSCSDPDEDELYYSIYFGTDPNPALILTNHPDTFYLPSSLAYASTYFWKIVACDIHGDSTEGNVWSFTTKPEFECGDILLDTRDNQTYTTVQIGAQCWMSENLNFGSRIDGIFDMSNNNIIEKYCYDDLESNCNSLGALYQWDELMVYTTQQGTQGICPVGWHVPTDTEWFQLANFVDLTVNNPSYQGWMGIDCGTKLKEGGETEFEVIMAGERLWDTGEFMYLALKGFFWTSNQHYSSMSWFWSMDIDNPAIYRQAAMKTYGLSIRCILD
jgi:uncharacterized protein (TIGR02145 family)